jgi:hypothetical protein
MARDKSVNPATIAWGTNISQREADTAMFYGMSFDLSRQYRKTGKRLRILSFPDETWSWELSLENLFSHIPMEFLGLARNAAIHKKTKKFASVLPRRFEMTDKPVGFQTFAASNRKRRSFDVIYLDWLGTWNEEKTDDLCALFHSGLLDVGGLLILTVSLFRGHLVSEKELQDPSLDLPMVFYEARRSSKGASHLKVKGIPQWIQDTADDRFGVKMKPLLTSIHYRTGPSDEPQPQLQLMMLRES